ncbi:hypothetical protein OG912_38050 (plasmid) [Streptomyces sp. NBC_00464]|uniref:hypothetical protein n=1 Tax=Streptomyces sp. NBC_00464 TaxID=2975751 RepID=UPI002E19DB28
MSRSRCPYGRHPFPEEDETGTYCDEHGVTMLWRPPPADDPAPAVPSPQDTDPEIHPGQ